MATKSLKNPKKTTIRGYLYCLRMTNGNQSQRDVAKALGMDYPTYNQIECGKQGRLMNAEKLYGLAKILNVSVEKVALLEIKYQREIKRANGVEVEYDPEFDDVKV